MKAVGNVYIVVFIMVATSVLALGQGAPEDKLVAATFENHAREYSERRETIEAEMKALPKEATAEEISQHKSELLKKVLAERKAARRGAIFTPEAERLIRSVIKREYPGRDGLELRKELAEAENKTVALRVNAVYPEAAELVEMPPTLLLALPPLPKQLRYRFVGSNLLIVDRENHLIVDYMTKALP